MTSQDDMNLMWYSVPFSSADPSDLLLNTGNAPPPMLSDHPRTMMTAQHITTSQMQALSAASNQHQANQTHHLMPQTLTASSYADPSTLLQTHHSQVLYDSSTGDYITPPDYMYETLDSYDDDSASQAILPSSQHDPNTPMETATQIALCNQQMYQEDDSDQAPTPKTKKPKVHNHPLLKLKTPIAYQKDTDLNAIPIMKEGMAVCEKCGAIGVKHAFYGKERKFCSLACARPPVQPVTKMGLVGGESENDSTRMAQDSAETGSEDESSKSNLPISREELSEEMNEDCRLTSKLPPGTIFASESVEISSSNSIEDPLSEDTSLPVLEPYSNQGSYDWTLTYLKRPDFRAVPVKCFPHAPMSECWENMGVGMKVEVSCGAEGVSKDAYWVATVIGIAGYKACLRFEGCQEDSCHDFWVDLCSEEVYPVGWCATQGKALIPPRFIQNKYSDWKQFLMKRLTGARTLPTNFHSKVMESHKSRFKVGLNVEVVDKNRIAQMRVATVIEIVGKRLHLKYHGAPPHDNGFWCHEDAPIIHPIGWSRDVGHEIVASQSYHEKCIAGDYETNDSPPSLFLEPPLPSYLKTTNGNCRLKFVENMKIEAIDPLNLATICVATVMKVLRNNYLMIRIDSYDNDDRGSDWFCYHATSPCIFPPGFCQMNSIKLTPPKGFEGEFTWFNYLKATNMQAAPPALFNREINKNHFEPGMSIEATDLMDPRLVCVATVKHVKGRLLQIHFDGWEVDFDQWVDAHSCDIYPVGWCQMVGYKLECPRNELSTTSNLISNKRKLKTRGTGRRRGGGRGGGANGILTNSSNNIPMEGRGGMEASAPPPPPTSTGRRGRPPKNRGGGSSVTSRVPEIKQETNQWQPNSVAMETKSSTNFTNNQHTNISGQNDDKKENIQWHLDNYKRKQMEQNMAASEAKMDEDSSSGVASLVDSDDIGDDTAAVDDDNVTEDSEMKCEYTVMNSGQQNVNTANDSFQNMVNTTSNSTLNANQNTFDNTLLNSASNNTNFSPLDGMNLLSNNNMMSNATANTNLDIFGSALSPNINSFPNSYQNGLASALPPQNIMQNNSLLTSTNQIAGGMQWSVTNPPAILPANLPPGTILPPNLIFQQQDMSAVYNNSGQQIPTQQFIPTPQVVNNNVDINSAGLTVLPTSSTQHNLLSSGANQPLSSDSNQPSFLPSGVSLPTSLMSSSNPMVSSSAQCTSLVNGQVTVTSDSMTPVPQKVNLFIPRLSDGTLRDGTKVQPKLWSPQDVASFLVKNDCASYSQYFLDKNIGGTAFMELNQDPSKVMELTGMKVGPSLKIQDLMKQLIALVSPSQARFHATLMKRSYNKN